MNTIKETFFDKGFISPIKALDVSTATEIKNKYVNFYENISSTREKVEHKSKSHLLFNWANEIIFEKNILSVVKEILGQNIVAWNSLIFMKPPKSKKYVSFHQDQNYWNIKMDKGLTVQIALSPSTIENGCLQILPGSHNQDYSHLDKKDTNNLLARGQEVQLTDKEKNNLKKIILNPGEFCIFHGNIVHGSNINNSDDYRVLFSIRYLTPDNKIDEKLYYNYATKVCGVDDFKYFKEEPNLDKDTPKICSKFHNQLISKQAEIYSKIYLKKFSFLSFLTKLKFIRNLIYLFREYRGKARI